MKRILLLAVLAMLLCGGCSVMPGEERAFAVCLGLGRSGDTWQACARVPSYQEKGGYLTLTALGNSLGEALAALDAVSPLPLHFGQLRLTVFSLSVAEGADFPETLAALSMLPDFRLRSALCVTRNDLPTLMDAMIPETGARLSKYIDVLLETRQGQGVAPVVTLSSLRRMGERQSPVLIGLALAQETQQMPGLDVLPERQAAQGAGELRLGGGWLVGQDGAVHGELTLLECQLLALVSGRLREGTLALREGAVTLLDASCDVRTDGVTAVCSLRVRVGASPLTSQGVSDSLTAAVQGLLTRLTAADCDALGLGRQVMARCESMAAWHGLDWPTRYRQLTWQVDVAVASAA